MRTSSFTANQWKWLALVFVLAGVAVALTISVVAGVLIVVGGALIALQAKLGVDESPKSEPTRRP